MSLDQCNIAAPQFKVNPYPIFQNFREEAPIVRLELPGGIPFHLITRYDDAEAAFKDLRFTTEIHKVMSPEMISQMFSDSEFMENFRASMIFKSPPDHTRLKSLVNIAFTPRNIEKWAERIQVITDELLETFPEHGEVDLMEAYAHPLPLQVFSEIFGIPTPDRQRFREWTQAFVNAAGDPVETHRIQPQMAEFLQYLYDLIDEKSVRPTQDVIGMLIRAEAEGSKLSRQELAGMVFLLLLAGNETTVNLIGNGVLLLLQHPDQLTKIRQEPALVKSAIEEILRYRGPVMNPLERWVQEDFEFRGHQFKKGDMVYICMASANRDATHCPHADTFDVTRTNNQHLAFGYGIHFCLGAPLARLEGRIAFESLLQRFPDIQLSVAPESLEYRAGSTTIGLQSLPVTF